LLADLFHALTGKAHPSRPTAKKPGGRASSTYRAKREALERQRARLEAQKS